jgi:heme-degrading monooxygenase HmoA
MVEIVWEVVVKEEARGQFELAYGPGGAWSELFAGWPGFRGIMLLRDVNRPRHYLTIELWESVADREQAREERAAEYATLEVTLAGWVESRTEVGAFRALAEATVRPRGRAERAYVRDAARRGRRASR